MEAKCAFKLPRRHSAEVECVVDHERVQCRPLPFISIYDSFCSFYLLYGACDNDCLSVNQSLCGISHAFHFYEMWCRLFKRVFVVQYRLAIDLSYGQIYDLPRAWFLIIDYETIEDFRRVLCGSRTWDRVWGSSKSRRRNCLSVSLPKDCTFIYTV